MRASRHPAQNTTGAAGSLTNIYNRVVSGERLTPEQRTDFTQQAHGLFQSQLQSQQELQAQYRGIAQQTMPNSILAHRARFRRERGGMATRGATGRTAE